MDEKALINLGLLRWGEARDFVEMFRVRGFFRALGLPARSLRREKSLHGGARMMRPTRPLHARRRREWNPTGGVELHVVGGEAVHPEALGSQ